MLLLGRASDVNRDFLIYLRTFFRTRINVCSKLANSRSSGSSTFHSSERSEGLYSIRP